VFFLQLPSCGKVRKKRGGEEGDETHRDLNKNIKGESESARNNHKKSLRREGRFKKRAKDRGKSTSRHAGGKEYYSLRMGNWYREDEAFLRTELSLQGIHVETLEASGDGEKGR